MMNRMACKRAASGVVLMLLLSGCAVTNDKNGTLASATDFSAQQLFEMRSAAEKAYVDSRWHEAAREFQALTELVPGDAWLWFRLGNVHARQGAYNEAIRAYGASLELDGNNGKAWYNLSTAYLLNAQQALQTAATHIDDGMEGSEKLNQRIDAIRDIVSPVAERKALPQQALHHPR